jgi:hypothetical protein
MPLAFAILFLVGAACSASSQTAPTVGATAGEGVVRQGVGPECPRIWHIATASGDKYWPIENPAFQKDGLRVRFSVRPRTDLVSTCMAGTIVELIAIEEIR